MNDIVPVTTIANLIQISIAPVFLLAGVGAILNVLVNRLARVFDRVRRLEAEFSTVSPRFQQLVRAELRTLGRRMKLVNWSIAACTASALAVCLVVAILFIGGFANENFGRIIAGLFVLTMALLVIGLILFLIEVRLAAHTLKVRYEWLEESFDTPSILDREVGGGG